MVFGKLFGKREKDSQPAARREGDVVEYGPYTITPAPLQQGSTWNVAGHITRREPHAVHEFIRADTHADWEQACSHAVQKAKQIIDQQGERAFKLADAEQS